MCGELFSLNFEAIGLMVHCIINSEVEKLINGYDYCGNICGKNNLKTNAIPFECFGKNFENHKYLVIKDEHILTGKRAHKTCFKLCLVDVAHYCVRNKSVIPFYVKLLEFYWWHPAVYCGVSVIYCFFICALFYCTDKADMKLSIRPELIILLFIIIIVGLSLKGYSRWNPSGNNQYFILPSILAIIVVVALVAIIPSLYANFKKVYIVYQLYQEVGKATNSMKSIWIFPIQSSTIIGACVYGLIYCSIYLESFSYPEKIDELSPDEPIIEYIPYLIATTTQALLIYTIFLLYEFLKNLQTLIISGWVAQRYFTKKDDEEFKPSTKPLLKHLGSVCCASLILSATFPIRVVVNALKGIIILSYKECFYTCSRFLTTKTLFFTRNGLIMTAVHGSSFCAGTTRARKLLHHNVFNAAGISTFGDFTLLLMKLVLLSFPNMFCNIYRKISCCDSIERELVELVF